MHAALEHAKRSGADVLEAVGFHKSKRDVLEQMKPHHQIYPSCPYLFKVKADCQPLQVALRNTDVWDASQFDGVPRRFVSTIRLIVCDGVVNKRFIEKPPCRGPKGTDWEIHSR